MKRSGIFIILIFFITLTAAYMAAEASNISATKHNLSTGGTGSIKSDTGGTSEICVFCHTPHSSRMDAPLWNRTTSTYSYQTYTSDVLAGLPYPAAQDPSNQSASGYQVHVKTRICLSCHDGTIALGKLVNLPPDASSSEIPMVNTGNPVGGSNAMPYSAQGYIGTDLRDDHPVAIPYTTADFELKSTVSGSVRLYWNDAGMIRTTKSAGADNFVECTSCHEPHDNQYGNFLVELNSGSAICTDCHSKKMGVAVTTPHHGDSAVISYNPDGTGNIGTTVGNVKCMNCHFPHKAGITDTSQLPKANTNPDYGSYLLSFQKDNSCFNSPNRWNRNQPSSVCHGTNGTGGSGKDIDILSEVSKGNALHKYVSASYGNRHSPVEAKSYGWDSTNSKRHIECSDCHNSHTAGSGPLHSAGSNTISSTSPLYGVGYASINYGGVGAWNEPLVTAYSPVEPLGVTDTSTWTLPRYEYEICFKCHSNFSWGGGSPPNSPSLGSAATNQAKEFNTANGGFHPVAGINSQRYQIPSGSWTVGSGFADGTTMYCSDCHGNNEPSPQPQGPHGSTKPFILRYDFDVSYNTTTNGSQDQLSTDLCFQCHVSSVYNTYLTGDTTLGTGFYTTGGIPNYNLHNRHKTVSRNAGSGWAYRCVNCHTKIPHGYTRRGMVVAGSDTSDAPTYAVGGIAGAKITGFQGSGFPATPQTYGTLKGDNCSTAAGCH